MFKVIKYLKLFVLAIVLLVVISTLAIIYLYQPVQDGTIEIEGFKGKVTITREKDTGIAHIKADKLEQALYGQGFATAQTRLWQMEKQRRIAQGTLSELVGEKALPVDKFSRIIGYHREAQEALHTLTHQQKELIQAYCDGVNEYINKISLTGRGASARLLPPEFYALGIDGMDEWTIEDVLSISKVMTFNLTWNWNQELLREIYSDLHPDIAEMIEEIAPFTAEFSHNLVTIIDEEDLPEHEKLQKGEEESTILKRYQEHKRLTASGIIPQYDLIKEQKQIENQEKEQDQEIEDKHEDQEPQVIDQDHKDIESLEKNLVSDEKVQQEVLDNLDEQETIQNIEEIKETEQQNESDPYVDQLVDEIINNRSVLDDQHASNNWVIHGNHTESGRPILSNDPHLSTGMPSQWVLMSLEWGRKGQFVSGANIPGIPMIHIGRSKNFSWGITAPVDDISDLYKEKFNESKNKYMLDGEWKDLVIKEEFIKIKGRDQPYKQVIKFTHRGPIIDSELVQGGSVLFSGTIPKQKGENKHYSFVWGTHYNKGETSMQVFQALAEESSVSAFQKRIHDIGCYKGVVMNLVFASREGDIGYMLLSPQPVRKNYAPHNGGMIQDGTISDYDWKNECVLIKDMPQVINPKKGFIVTANNRQMPEQSKSGIGISLTATVRAQRINEMIQSYIQEGKKISVDDSIDILQNEVDMCARDLIQPLLKIFDETKHKLSRNDRSDAERMIGYLENWDGNMDQYEIAPTIYSYWQVMFYKTLFRQYESDEHTIMALSDNYPFVDFYSRLIQAISQNSDQDRYNRLCKGYNLDYDGDDHCAYNIAIAFAETRTYLQQTVSLNESDWLYRNVHHNTYPAVPWSMTPLKFLFARDVPTGGNTQTVSVSKTSTLKAFQSGFFASSHTANLKLVVGFAESQDQDISLYSIDTGIDGNLFAGHYFDMNANHLAGKLHQMYYEDQLNDLETSTLTLTAAKSKPKSKSRSQSSSNSSSQSGPYNSPHQSSQRPPRGGPNGAGGHQMGNQGGMPPYGGQQQHNSGPQGMPRQHNMPNDGMHMDF